ncbi:thiol reductant ABC exporter subunit CydC [Streptomyces longispororuber]|uniref:thiol reductant ABC exporter subunit CydC n=1 Tax=Streptomyces longispororuber TaxID=68230 RepID=UPI0036FBCEA1
MNHAKRAHTVPTRHSRLVRHRHAVRLGAAAAAGAAAEMCALGLAGAAAWMIARAAEQPSIAALGLAIVVVRGCAVFKGVFRYVERLAGHDAALRILADLRVRVFESLVRGREPVRDSAALTRMVSDVDGVQDLLLRCLLPATAAVTAAAAALGFVVVVDPGAGAVLAGGLAGAGIVLPAVVHSAARRAGALVAREREELAAAGLDLCEGADDLAVFGAADRARAVAVRAAERLAVRERRAERLGGAALAVGTVLQALTALGVLLAARPAGTVVATTLTLTALVAMEVVLPMAVAGRCLATAWPAARRVTALLAAPWPTPPAHPAALPAGPLDLALLNVSVRYGGRPALVDVDLTVRRGQRVAVVGASGAGKSTLLAAVAGDVPVTGSVLLAGQDLSCYAPEQVRLAVRGLEQDAHVFTASVRANLLLARPDATDDELVAAARRARILAYITALPDGWDTEISETSLSGGQRQRLLLARAFLSDPQVLLLDEPTEGLDIPTADALTRDLLRSPHGGTLLMVTHRLAALGAADQILVMDEGRIVQRGTHAELSAVPGPYQDLMAAELLTAGQVRGRSAHSTPPPAEVGPGPGAEL